MSTTVQTETDLLVSCLRVLNLMAEQRSTYDRIGRQTEDFSALAAGLLMADELAMGEPATIPDSLRVERVEEQLEQLFAAAHVILHAYTSLCDE